MPIPNVPDYWGPDGQKLAKTSDFWADNPYNDPYSAFTKQAGGYAKDAFDSANADDPFAGGGGWNAALTRMGSGYPNINDPATKSALSSYMANMAGGRNKMLTGAASNMANASIGATRGGYGVAGGASPEVAAYKTAMDTASSQYGNDFKTSMDYLYKNASLDMQTKQALMELLKAKYGVGENMMGMELQGLQSGQRGLEDWLKSAYGAYSGDVNRYNQNVMDEPFLRNKIAEMARQQSRQVGADYQQGNISTAQQAIASGMGRDTVGGFDPTLNSPMAVLYRSLLAKGAVPALQGFGKGSAGAGGTKAKGGAAPSTDPMQAMLAQLQAVANPAGATTGIGSRGGTSRLPSGGGGRAAAPTDTSGTAGETIVAPGDYEGYGGPVSGPQAGAATPDTTEPFPVYGPFSRPEINALTQYLQSILPSKPPEPWDPLSPDKWPGYFPGDPNIINPPIPDLPGPGYYPAPSIQWNPYY